MTTSIIEATLNNDMYNYYMPEQLAPDGKDMDIDLSSDSLALKLNIKLPQYMLLNPW